MVPRLRLATLLAVSALLPAPFASARPSAPAAHGQPRKLLVVMIENESRIHALWGMPRLTATAKASGIATNYRAITHPSLPNYLAIAGGSTFGVTDDASPGSHSLNGPSIFGQALAKGATAKTYAESMPTKCSLVPAGRYAVKHNPWTYFSDPAERAACEKFDVPAGTTSAGALRDDVTKGTLPTVGMLIPNLCNDAHDCPLSVADGWLAKWLITLRRGPDWTSGRLAIVVTFDEDDYSEGNHVLTVVMAPGISHQTVGRHLDHYSLTRYADELIGAPLLRSAQRATSLAAAFPALGS